MTLADLADYLGGLNPQLRRNFCHPDALNGRVGMAAFGVGPHGQGGFRGLKKEKPAGTRSHQAATWSGTDGCQSMLRNFLPSRVFEQEYPFVLV